LAHILSVNIGKVAALFAGDERLEGVRSAIHKSSVSSLAEPHAVKVGWLGLEGDEQADPSVHGGRDKALYAYPHEHYAVWRTIRMQALKLDEELPYGSLGENLTLTGLTESAVWIGDVIAFGPVQAPSVVARVASPRAPCFKLNARLGFKHAAKMMVQSGYTGFYLEVMETGSLRAGDEIRVLPGERVMRVDEMHRRNTQSRQRDLL
jgi:MOSC domain-containing protein YiiM